MPPLVPAFGDLEVPDGRPFVAEGPGSGAGGTSASRRTHKRGRTRPDNQCRSPGASSTLVPGLLDVGDSTSGERGAGSLIGAAGSTRGCRANLLEAVARTVASLGPNDG